MDQEKDQFQEFEKMIDEISELLTKFDEQLQQNLKVAMIVGSTGNGKSTVFNFLSGFEFQINQEEKKKIKYLALKNPNEKYASHMASGSKPITQVPQYFFNKNNNYLLIDFPGFTDPGGLIKLSYISILFNRIVLKTPIRLITVLKTPDGDLPNRQQELNDFIKRCFAQDIKQFSQVTLILNQYMDDLEDKDLIDLVKNQFYEISQNQDIYENIAVIRKIRNDDDLERKLNEQKRQEIWKVIENSNPIRFKSTQFDKQDELAKLINQKLDQIMQNLVAVISKQVDNSLNKLSKQTIEDLYQQFYNIELLEKKQSRSTIFSITNELLETMQEIAKTLGWENNQKNEITTFLKIFKFISLEEDVIQINEYLNKNRQVIQGKLIIQQKTIFNRILAIAKKNDEDEINQEKQRQQNLNEKRLEEKRQRDQEAKDARQRDQEARQREQEAESARQRNQEAEAARLRNQAAQVKQNTQNKSTCKIM
ncbi:unnamed protein product [Paramecium octaurelia]|uniref:G domain-containing protein n=1 Tax=Paramecium octaurelia TaxID=43137 RepID=A0A8S1V5L2_PAROT|nr:unnamed protein product [Paramecium octaurelia]